MMFMFQKCSDYMASSIPTFARTEPPDTQVRYWHHLLLHKEWEFINFKMLISSYLYKVTKSVISLLHYYGWKKFSIIHEELWTTVANSLKEQAKSKNMTINHCKKVVDNHKCCENNLACCRSGYWHQVFNNIIHYNFFKI